MKKEIAYFLAMTLLLLMTQCENTIEEMGECPVLDAPHASYTVHVYPIISTTCAIPQCHSTDFEYGDFNYFEEVKKRANNGKLKFMLETHQMPHGFTDGPRYLTTCQVETIKKWIHEGAKNN